MEGCTVDPEEKWFLYIVKTQSDTSLCHTGDRATLVTHV